MEMPCHSNPPSNLLCQKGAACTLAKRTVAEIDGETYRFALHALFFSYHGGSQAVVRTIAIQVTPPRTILRRRPIEDAERESTRERARVRRAPAPGGVGPDFRYGLLFVSFRQVLGQQSIPPRQEDEVNGHDEESLECEDAVGDDN
eukprot:CAMPEP_0172573518 /NCGR_PEP_ID=MMETSP1067-20121228/136233_1 /TAXON_ID=265564 ORGANISM="Thalassiosira punctigera, Strain Tpunct2005C2" /NCGR_SAMPLE_ID=MMETSP1067 /ASSEMBLY_ACC=CAM_ASM_000444 /LENGTH=145 /DNA_ID=CAMNT_0013366125 /DNA_START=145 /DNA_END=582 /DNA_ORIENTATION=-